MMNTRSRYLPTRSFAVVARLVVIVGMLVAGLVPIGAFSTTAASADPPASTILPWGDRDFGATNPTPAVPAGEKVVVSAGENFSRAVTDAGTVLAWGDNTNGEVSPLPTVPVGEKVIAIAAGGSASAAFSLALTDAGTILAWGATIGALPSVPVGETVNAISAGSLHALALTDAGPCSRGATTSTTSELRRLRFPAAPPSPESRPDLTTVLLSPTSEGSSRGAVTSSVCSTRPQRRAARR